MKLNLSDETGIKLRRFESDLSKGKRKPPKWVKLKFWFYCFGECRKFIELGEGVLSVKALKFHQYLIFCETYGKKYLEKEEK